MQSFHIAVFRITINVALSNTGIKIEPAIGELKLLYKWKGTNNMDNQDFSQTTAAIHKTTEVVMKLGVGG